MEKKQKKASNSELMAAWLCFNSLRPELTYSTYSSTWHIKDMFDGRYFMGDGKTLNEAVLNFYHDVNKERDTL